MSDTIRPVAWRYEVRGNNADGFPTTEWREYGTYSTQNQAESHLAYCGNGIEGRILPLYTADALRQAKIDALEEAAQACEKQAEDYLPDGGIALELRIAADSIRALKEVK